MYLRQVHIKNIRSIRELRWNVRKEAGWHVVIGDNGSGKSTFLRAIALALVGPDEAAALRLDWKDWLSHGQEQGSVRLDLSYNDAIDKFAGKGRLPQNYLLPASIRLTQIEGQVKLRGRTNILNADRHIWSGRKGWFSASYGPFRRFQGGDKDYEKIFYSNPRLAAHLSVFGENVALTEAINWLQQLQFKKLERKKEGELLNRIIEFVNQKGFLPHNTKLQDISSGGVTFVDGNGCKVSVDKLSDGYRSILSMTFELIRQMTHSYQINQIFDLRKPGKIMAPGVVLIDEIDAHLHPTWQRRIGMWFREHFPNIQFIVTTHSPLICQAAEVGTVWRLPKPGTEEKAKMITGTDLERLLHGNVLDAYGTELFGENVARSEKSQEMMDRLAELNLKEMNAGLTKKEEQEQAQLRATMPTTAHQTSKSKRRNGHD